MTIQFDYTYDQFGLFDDPARHDLLEFSAAQINRFVDHMAAIEPTGDLTWTYLVDRPDKANKLWVVDDVIPADTVKVYVGGRPLSSGFHALAAVASFWIYTLEDDWEQTVLYRNVSGAAADPAADYAPYAGSITFNTDQDWYFGLDTGGLGANQVDFVTVATHELLHILGYGPADSWQAQIEDGQFTGEQATAVGSPTNPSLTLDGSRGHWAAGTVSQAAGITQTALLNPFIARGQRLWPTDLDRAALLDIGWEEALPGDTDLDRDIDGFDIQSILAAGKFGTGPSNATWAEGDFTGDRVVNGFDIQAILATNQFGKGPYTSQGQSGALAPRAVPEPSTMAMLFFGCFALLGWMCRWHRTA